MHSASGPDHGGLTIGVMGRSRKENEHRLALHPAHLAKLPPEVGRLLYLEEGYGAGFGVTDAELAETVAGLRSHADLVAECDVILQPKPVLEDIAELRPGQVFWGWPHCVQDEELTQLAIDRRLTVIAFEAMNHWNSDDSFSLHVFHKNNELAGYCSVLHAMQLAGVTGHYGTRRRAVVIGFGATARGAVTALNGLGVTDVQVLTHREVAAVAAPIHSVQMVHFGEDVEGSDVRQAITEDGPQHLASYLAEHDVIVNCVLQNPESPMLFLNETDLPLLAPGTLIVDVSCDQGMGFSWARATTFDEPTFEVGDRVSHYGVDHSPSHLWASATWENSAALLPFLPVVMGGPDAWEADPTITRAIEIRDGVVLNPSILSFQGREIAHPHGILAS